VIGAQLTDLLVVGPLVQVYDPDSGQHEILVLKFDIGSRLLVSASGPKRLIIIEGVKLRLSSPKATVKAVTRHGCYRWQHAPKT